MLSSRCSLSVYGGTPGLLTVVLGLVLLLPALATAQVRDTRWQVTEIYMATMDAAPDEEGLSYWISNIQHNGWEPLTVAQSFFDQPLVQAQYPATSDYTFFITSLYQNIFGRNPDSPGLNYWIDELRSGRIARNQMIIALINGGYSAAQTNPISADDMARFTNRVRVALAFADYQATYDILYSQLVASDRAILLDAGKQVLLGVGSAAGDDLSAIARIPELLRSLNGELSNPSSDAYTPGTPAPGSASTLTSEVAVVPGSAAAISLVDGTRVDIPSTSAEFVTTLKRSSNTVQAGNYFPSGSKMVASGAMRTLEFSGSGDASNLKPLVTIPSSELGTLNRETVFVLRQAMTMVEDEWVDDHFTVLSAEFDSAGNLQFLDPLVPDSLVTYLFNPGSTDTDGRIVDAPTAGLQSSYAAAEGDMAWIGNVRYSVMSFEQSLNWSESPMLVRTIPDATLADSGFRRRASAVELQALQKQPICNVVLLVHGHNENEKMGFEAATVPAPWKVGYKRLVWDLLYKTFLDGGTLYPQGCTAFYEFIYPSYRPIFSPVLEKSGFPHETLGEALGKLFKRELTENRQLAAMLASDMPFNLSIVAHSMGGLVARAGLRHMPAPLLDRYERLVTWGTPHHGAGLYSLLYALRAGHDLNWMGARIPMHNIGQKDAFGEALDGLAIDTPGTRDLRWSAGRKSMMALGSVMSENMVTGFERSEVELPNGSRFYSTNLQSFNESEGRWMGERLDNTFTFFYGTTTKTADVEVGRTWRSWLQSTLNFGGATGIQKGASLNAVAMQPAYAQSDGAVPVWSQRGAGLARPYGIKRISTGDVDHEEFYGAEPDQRTKETLRVGESIARATLQEADFDKSARACPALSAAVVFSSGDVDVSGALDYPALQLVHGGDGQVGARVAAVELRRDRADGPTVSGLTSRVTDNGSLSLVGSAGTVSDIDTGFLVAVLHDGSEVVSSPLTGFDSGAQGERVSFSQDYRFAEGSSGDWPEQLFVRLAGDLRINIGYRGEPMRQVQIEPPRLVLEDRYETVPSLVLEIKVPWSGADYDVAVTGTVSLRPSAESGSYATEGRTVNWALDQPADPLRRYRQTSCEQFSNENQFDISTDGSAGVAFTVQDLVSECDLVLEYTAAPYDDSYIDVFGNYWRLRTAYTRIVLRIRGYN